MVRFFFLTLGLSSLGACTGAPFNDGAAPSWSPGEPSARAFRFDWRLSGDPAVAPMQVFDNGKDIWLQFAPGQSLPAIFGMRESGEQALPYVRRDPYIVVSGDWPALRFRGGRLAARADREKAEKGNGQDVSPPTAGIADAVSPLASVGELASGGPLRAEAHERTTHAMKAIDAAPVSAPAPSAAQPQPVHAPMSAGAETRFRAAPPDATLRGVLARWADSSGWMFAPEHWAVDVDIPLSAPADFSGDFKSAVRQLLSATELAERPLQPCFYGNRVLRVVPLAQSCSRAVTPPGGGA